MCVKDSKTTDGGGRANDLLKSSTQNAETNDLHIQMTCICLQKKYALKLECSTNLKRFQWARQC